MTDGEGTSFLQWRERTQSELRTDRPKLGGLLITAGAVVVLGIVVGIVVLLVS